MLPLSAWPGGDDNLLLPSNSHCQVIAVLVVFEK